VPPQASAREWLRTNGYVEIANMIDEIMAEWKSEGKGTRRNWWQVLAGDNRGNPRKIAGRTFPVIKAIRRRQALPKCANAESNTPREAAPPITPIGRWATHTNKTRSPK
jgi:hypothetical protein